MHNESMREPADLPSSEPVRRCAACGAAAMIPVQVWAHTGPFARPGQRTIDCRCQACGASVTLPDPLVIKQEKQTALFLVWTIIAPMILLPRANRGAKAWADHPVVSGAPYPELRYDRPEAQRTCGKCGQPADLIKVERSTTNGIPSGTDRTYRCGSCGNEFTTESASGVASNIIGAVLFLGGGLIAMTEQGSDTVERWVLGPMALAAGVWFVYATIRAVRSNARNKVV